MNGLTQPPNFSLAGRRSVDLVYASARTSGHPCQPGPWCCVYLPAEFNTQPPPIAARAGSLGKSVGEIGEVCSLPLTLSQSQQPPETVTSTKYVQGTCPNRNININKPLYSLVPLSLSVFCSAPAACQVSIPAVGNRVLCAFCEAVPVTGVNSFPAENLWFHGRHLTQV